MVGGGRGGRWAGGRFVVARGGGGVVVVVAVVVVVVVVGAGAGVGVRGICVLMAGGDGLCRGESEARRLRAEVMLVVVVDCRDVGGHTDAVRVARCGGVSELDRELARLHSTPWRTQARHGRCSSH